MDVKKNKINKKPIIDNNCNLKKAEKGLKILGEIAVRRGHKNEIQVKKDKNKLSNKNNKKSERNTQKCLEKNLIKKNSNESIFKSVNKDILKGISKIEKLFNKKCSNSNFTNCSKKNENYSDKKK